jgi:hypothetical protein
MASGISNPSVVDVVTVDPKSDEYAMIMIATEPWSDKMVLALQAKTQTYLSFVEAGELIKQYPAANGKTLRFQLDTSYELSASAAKFVAVASREWLQPMGIEFRVVPARDV